MIMWILQFTNSLLVFAYHNHLASWFQFNRLSCPLNFMLLIWSVLFGERHKLSKILILPLQLSAKLKALSIEARGLAC